MILDYIKILRSTFVVINEQVKYQKDLKVKFGNVLKPSDVRSIPIEVKWQTEENALYTLCLTDPDAPTRSKPEFREWHHWLVVNIPGNNIAAGDTLSAYIGSGPPKGSGLHRYVFLAYKQPGRIDIDQEPKLGNRSDVGRGLFSITRFAQRHFLGTPVAGNFYQAQWDEYVPELEKQLSGQ